MQVNQYGSRLLSVRVHLQFLSAQRDNRASKAKEGSKVKEIVMTPIGLVSNDISVKKDTAWGKDVSRIVLDHTYAGCVSLFAPLRV